MVWNDPFYLGKNCFKTYKKLKHRISRGLVHPGVYLLALPQQDGPGVLEIIPSLLLLQKSYPTEELRIVGMAATRQEALSIVEQIVSDTVHERGDADVPAFMCGS